MISFELFADSKGLIITETTNATTRQRRRAMLLHFAGQDVQEIFSTPADTCEATDYTAAITALNGYFLLKVNMQPSPARNFTDSNKWKEGETVLQFVTRLSKEGKDCNFGVDFDNQMRDAVLCKCRSDYVRRKLLEEREELTLARTLEIAEQCESVYHQMSHLSVSEPSKEDANRVYEKSERPDGKQNRMKKGVHCYRCGSSRQMGRDPKCPSRGQTCRKCKGKDHFARVCKSKPKKAGVNRVQEELEANNGEQVDYAFRVTNEAHSNLPKLSIGGVELEMLVDSGATNNIVDEETWEDLKAKKIKCKSEAAPIDRKLYAYASSKPLPVKGRFICEVLIGKGKALLCKNTAMKLGVLGIGVDVTTVAETKQTLQQQFPEVFSGIGKLSSTAEANPL